MPEWDKEHPSLTSLVKDIEGPDFWFSKGIMCAKEGKADAAMDYYRQGLLHNPSDEMLLYSFANGYLL